METEDEKVAYLKKGSWTPRLAWIKNTTVVLYHKTFQEYGSMLCDLDGAVEIQMRYDGIYDDEQNGVVATHGNGRRAPRRSGG